MKRCSSSVSIHSMEFALVAKAPHTLARHRSGNQSQLSGLRLPMYSSQPARSSKLPLPIRATSLA
jgi:hypothetical protein